MAKYIVVGIDTMDSDTISFVANTSTPEDAVRTALKIEGVRYDVVYETAEINLVIGPNSEGEMTCWNVILKIIDPLNETIELTVRH